MTNDQRIAIEKRIARAVAKDLIEAGYSVTVNDGEEDVLEASTDISAILAVMFSTDQVVLVAIKPGAETRSGWVYFIYGNSGYDVVNDYTTNLEAALAKSTALADKLETQNS